MSLTKKVLIGGVNVTLYSPDGRNWFSSPKAYAQTKERLEGRKEFLKRQWRQERPFNYEVVPAGDADGE